MHLNKYTRMTEENKQTEQKEEAKKPQDHSGVMMEGHIKIWDPESGEVIVDKRNAIHYENMSQALANSLANKSTGFVHEMAFGNGGTSVDPTGIITYLTPNSTGSNATLYNQTYYKVIDDNSSTNKDTTRNKMEVRHTAGNKYTDIVNYNTPLNQRNDEGKGMVVFNSSDFHQISIYRSNPQNVGTASSLMGLKIYDSVTVTFK